MHNFFVSFVLFNLNLLVTPILFFTMGVIMIAFGFRNGKRGVQQSRRPLWYQRLWIVLGMIQIITGGVVLIFSNVLPFSIPQVFSSTILLQFLLIDGIFGIYALTLLIRTVFKLSRPYQAIHSGNTNTPKDGSIATNPLLLLTRMLLIGEVCFLIVVSLSASTPLNTLLVEHQQSFYGWILLLAVPLLAFCLYRTYVRLRYLQWIELLRFARAAGRKDDKAAIPTPSTFSTPIMIVERIKRTHIGILALLVLLFAVPGMLPILLSSSFRMLSFLFFPFLIFGLLALVISFLPLFIIRNTINATDNGLSNSSGGFVSWQEASLFACYRLPGLLGGYTTTEIYELSSPDRVIRWHWIHSPQSPFTILEPQLPVDVYRLQMQTLCGLVMEKTGLQLYDLSQSEE